VPSRETELYVNSHSFLFEIIFAAKNKRLENFSEEIYGWGKLRVFFF
jgi:hypothetical protein